MAQAQAAPAANGGYAALEERILDRDQVGASAAYYDLYRDGEPLSDLLREVKEKVGFCEVCSNVAEDRLCVVCSDARRSRQV